MQLTEDNVADYAATLVERLRTGGYALDYTEASLAIIEGLLRVNDSQFQKTDKTDLPDAHRDMVIFYNGCYVGEVLSRNLGGVWRFEENWSDSSLVFAHRDGGIQLFPFQKVFRRVTEGPEENDLVAYYQGLREQLETAS